VSATTAPQLHATPGAETSPLGPLCVDLDGTLIKTDLLVESALALVKRQFWALFLIPLWLLRGKAHLKRQISRRVVLNVSVLPYRASFVAWLKEERAAGRKLVLATASDLPLAQAVADHLGLFDLVLGTTETCNLAGVRKRDALVERFGVGRFSYAGDAAVDLPIWTASGEAIVVGASAGTERRARRTGKVTKVFPVEGGGLKAFVKAIRVRQWVKNVLLFVPIFTAHKLGDASVFGRAALAFVSFSLCASAVYLANDLMDLDADRQHRSKRNRPFASGSLPLAVGLVTAPCFVLASFALAVWLSHPFAVVLAIYFAITNAYTFALKKEALLDVVCLAALYTIRIFAGAESTGLPVSAWLSALSMFGFLSLALVKRVSELRVAKEASQENLHGRGYRVGDLQMLSQAGITTGYLAVLVFALYIHGEEVKALYRHPQTLWFVCPLLFYWISYVWLRTHRGQMHDDPVEFAVRDRTSYLIGLLAVGVVYLAR
jgi:4-hydroxybenzoate polyprenyltransferase/phosphoserine phosphatase